MTWLYPKKTRNLLGFTAVFSSFSQDWCTGSWTVFCEVWGSFFHLLWFEGEKFPHDNLYGGVQRIPWDTAAWCRCSFMCSYKCVYYISLPRYHHSNNTKISLLIEMNLLTDVLRKPSSPKHSSHTLWDFMELYFEDISPLIIAFAILWQFMACCSLVSFPPTLFLIYQRHMYVFTYIYYMYSGNYSWEYWLVLGKIFNECENEWTWQQAGTILWWYASDTGWVSTF